MTKETLDYFLNNFENGDYLFIEFDGDVEQAEEFVNSAVPGTMLTAKDAASEQINEGAGDGGDYSYLFPYVDVDAFVMHEEWKYSFSGAVRYIKESLRHNDEEDDVMQILEHTDVYDYLEEIEHDGDKFGYTTLDGHGTLPEIYYAYI